VLLRELRARDGARGARGARWLGRADQEAAEEAAFSGARLALERCRSAGQIVIGGRRRRSSSRRELDRRGREEVDLALDPLEGRGVVARGGNERDVDDRGRRRAARCRRCPTCTCARWPSARARAA
jgi:hypothetical protein